MQNKNQNNKAYESQGKTKDCKKSGQISEPRMMESSFDPNGTYTGNPSDGKWEKPVQDADDL